MLEFSSHLDLRLFSETTQLTISPLTKLTDQIQLLQHNLQRKQLLIFEGFLGKNQNGHQRGSIVCVCVLQSRLGSTSVPAECRHTVPETLPGVAPSCSAHSGRFLQVPMTKGHPAAARCTSYRRSPFSFLRGGKNK